MQEDLFKFIFVCGAERTGTTLLERILCTDSSVVPVVGELPVVAALLTCVKAAARQFDFFYRDYLASPAALEEVALAGIQAVARGIAERHPGHRTLVIKSPHLTPHVLELSRMFPAAPIVVLRRDPLDAVTSLHRVAERARSGNGHLGLVKAAEDIRTLTDRFLNFYMPLMTMAGTKPESVSYVSFEDLVQAPEREIGRLGATLGLQLRPPEASDLSLESSYLAEADRPYWSEHYRRPVTDKVVGVHKSLLEPADTALVLERSWRYREWAGYGNTEGKHSAGT